VDYLTGKIEVGRKIIVAIALLMRLLKDMDKILGQYMIIFDFRSPGMSINTEQEVINYLPTSL